MVRVTQYNFFFFLLLGVHYIVVVLQVINDFFFDSVRVVFCSGKGAIVRKSLNISGYLIHMIVF